MAAKAPLVVAFAALVACASSLSAAELGKLTVRSKFGQPLNADIELVSLKPGEEKNLNARLASRQAHWLNNIEFSRAVAGIRVSIVRRAGHPVLHLSTTEPVRERPLEALIVLGSGAGSSVQRYTLFPSTASAGPQPSPPRTAEAAAPAAARAPSPAPGDQPSPASREELFGLPAAETKASAQSKSIEWRGFVQNTTAYDYQDPTHWSRAVIRSQLGAQGGSGDFKWKASARLDVDPVYFNTDFYPEAVRKDQRAELLLRETYVDTSLAGLQLRLGKQHIVWGEMVALFFADVVSARDQRDFILPDFDILRIPQWAARAEYFGDNSHAEVIWLPYPDVDNIGKPGAEFYPLQVPPPPGFTQQFNDVVQPDRNLKNSNLGVRLSTLQSGWDVSAFYYRSTDVNPTFYREVSLAPMPTVTFTPRHDRIWQLGGTVAKDFRSFVAKAEAVYASGHHFNVTRLDEPDGVVPQDTLDYVIGLDFTVGRETRLNLQYFDRVFFNHDPDLLQDRNEKGATVLVSSKMGDSFYPEILIVQSLNRNDRLGRAKLGWQAERNLRLTLGLDIFHGPPTGLFGRFDDRDRIYGEVRYDF